MVPKTWPWYATSPSIWSAKSLTSDRSSAAESAPPGTRNTCWKSSARCGRNLVNLDSLPWINDVLVDKNGKLVAFVIGIGGFLGVDQKDVAVPFNSIRATWRPDLGR